MHKIKKWKRCLFFSLSSVSISGLIFLNACCHEDYTKKYFQIKDGVLVKVKVPGKREERLYIPESVRSIKQDAFGDCPKLKHLSISSYVNRVEPNTFDGCKLLTSKGLVNYSKVLFDWWVQNHVYDDKTISQMTEIDLGKIKNDEFELFSIISDYTFINCPLLSLIKIPDNIQHISPNAFANVPLNARYCVFSDRIKGILLSLNISEQQIFFDETLFFSDEDDYSKNKLKALTDFGKKQTTIAIPNGFETVKSSVFNYDNNVEKLIIPAKIYFRGFPFWEKCTKLKSIFINGEIDEDNCPEYNNINPEIKIYVTNETTRKSLLKSNVPNRQIILVKHYFYIQNTAIVGLSDEGLIKQVLQIPNGIDELAPGCFQNCQELVEMKLSNDLFKIGANAFNGCTGLKTINLPGGIHKIFAGTFENCSSLIKVVINSSSVEIAPNAFKGISPEAKFYVNSKNNRSELIQNGINANQIILQDGDFITQGKTLIGLTGAIKNANQIELPDDIDEIATNAINNCPNLTSVIFSNNVTVFNEAIFKNCPLLNKISLFASYVCFDPNTFQGINQNVQFNVVKTNVWNALIDCQISNEHIQLTEKNFCILDRKLIALTEEGLSQSHLVIPNEIEIIGDYAFNKANKLVSVMLPKKLKLIGKHAFNECKSLKEINIPSQTKVIQDYAFQGCSALNQAYIPESVVKIGENIFAGCESLTQVVNHSPVLFDWWVNHYSCDGNRLNQQRKISLEKLSNSLSKPFTVIGDKAFSNCNLLESITFHENITNIGCNILHNCPALLRVVILGLNIHIENESFHGCPNETLYYVYGEKVKNDLINNQIDSGFIICSQGKYFNFIHREIVSLTKLGKEQETLIIPENITSIRANAFPIHLKIHNLWFPKTINWICPDAFKNLFTTCLFYVKDEQTIQLLIDSNVDCKQIILKKNGFLIKNKQLIWIDGFPTNEQHLVIPHGVEQISTNDFKNLTWVKSIAIPRTVKIIDENAFAECPKNLLYGVYDEIMENYLLTVFPNIQAKNIINPYLRIEKSLGIIRNITEVGRREQTLFIPKNILAIDDYAFEKYENLVTLTIPGHVKDVNEGAFAKCSGLTEVMIQEGVNTLGANVFKDCSLLQSVSIAKSVVHIGEDIFLGCINLDQANVINNSTVLFNWWVQNHLYGDQAMIKLTEIDLSKCCNSLGEPFTIIANYAFKGCSLLEKVIIPNNVTNIGGFIFDDCKKLNKIINYSTILFELWVNNYKDEKGLLTKQTTIDLNEIRNSEGKLFTKINAFAFKSCSAAEIIIIPNTVTEISPLAFSQLRGEVIYVVENSTNYNALIKAKINPQKIILKNDDLINERKKIIGLTDQGKQKAVLNIPSWVDIIGKHTFQNLTALKKVIMQGESIHIESEAFDNCPNLKKIIFHGHSLSVDKNAFNNCPSIDNFSVQTEKDKSALVAIEISSNKIIYATDHFIIRGFSLIGLTESGKLQQVLTIPDYVTQIGPDAFNETKNLEKLMIHNQISEFDKQAFISCPPNVEYHLTNFHGEYNIPFLDLNPDKVFIHWWEFIVQNDTLVDLDFKNLLYEEIYIPRWIKKIHADGFKNCLSVIKRIILHEGITQISDGAFQWCTDRVSYLIVNEITQNLLLNSHSNIRIDQITCPHLVYNEFSKWKIKAVNPNGKRRKEIFISANFTEIGNEAFVDCLELERITLPKTIDNIGQNIFIGCGSLNPEAVINRTTIIFDWWVRNHKYGNKTLIQRKKVDLSNYLNSDNCPFTKIADGAFNNCHLLQEIIINKSITTIGSKNFKNCPLLEEEKVINNSPLLFEWWVNNHCYESFKLKDIKNVDLNFYRNSQKEVFTIIDQRAFFKNSHIISITIPHYVTKIGENAFFDCSDLKLIIINSENIEIGTRAFYGLHSSAKFYVINENVKNALLDSNSGIDEASIIT